MNNYSIDDVERSLREIDDLVTGVAHEEDEVASAEKKLLVTLPNSFKEYLKRWGNLSMGAIEYYGLTQSSNFENAGIPNFVWFTIKKRDEVGLPSHLVVFQNSNDEVYYCLNTDSFMNNSECSIVVWNNLDRSIDQTMAVDFFGFLLGDIEEYIEMMS